MIPATAPTLRGEGFDASEDGTGRGITLIAADQVIPFDARQIHHPANHSNPKAGDPCHPLRAVANCEPAVAYRVHGENSTAMVAHAFKFRGGGNSTGERGGNTGQSGGTGYLGQDECAFTVATSEDQMVAVPFAENSRSELRIEGDGKRTGALSAGGGKAGQGAPMIATRYAVRRLTPRECERLMSFPDDFTRIPWRGKPAEQCPDGPRYKALGNSWVVNEVKKLAHKIQLVEDIKSSLP